MVVMLAVKDKLNWRVNVMLWVIFHYAICFHFLTIVLKILVFHWDCQGFPTGFIHSIDAIYESHYLNDLESFIHLVLWLVWLKKLSKLDILISLGIVENCVFI
jgi:hypothetical protein